MADLIHWWQLPGKLMFKINREANNLLWGILLKKFTTIGKASERISEFTNFSPDCIKTAKCYQYYDKQLLKSICNLCNVSPSYIEKNILFYCVPASTKVIKPRLPIHVDLVFDNITAHMMADGGELRDGGGVYKQKNRATTLNLVRKLEYVFGKYLLSKSTEKILEDQGYYKTPIPKIFVQTIKNQYKIKSFECTESKVPSEILRKAKPHKLAFILAFIVDECCASRDRLIFSQKNRKLAHDLHGILEVLGYNPSKVRSDKRGNYRFAVYASDLLKLWLDLFNIIKKHPILSLCHKKKNIEKVLKKHINQQWIRALLAILQIQRKKSICSTRDLYHKMGVYREIVYDKIKRLKNWGYLKIVGKGKQKVLLFRLTQRGRKIASMYYVAYSLLRCRI
jgi:hypothetical protein